MTSMVDLLPRLLHRWHRTDLLKQRQHVLLGPLLDQFAVGDAVNGDGSDLHVVTGPRSSGQVAFVLPDGCQPRYHLVTFRNLVLDVVVAGSRLLEYPKRLFDAFSSLRQIWNGRWIMVDIVLGNEFVQDADV